MSVAGLLASQVKSMSKGFQNQNISFSNSFDRSTAIQLEDHDIAQQSRREKLRVPGFEPPSSSLVEDPGGGGGGGGGMQVYETGGMWSDMFNFQSGGGAASTSTEFIDSQISTAPPVGVVNGWYESRQGVGMGPLGDSKLERNNSGNRDRNSIAQSHQISSLNADSAAAMQLFLMNPQPRSPSPAAHPPPAPQPPLHLLLPNQSNPHQGFHHTPISPAQFQWVSSSSSTGAGTATQLHKIGAAVENQGGLSLTLSSSLQHLEAAKAEEQFRMENDGVFYYDQQGHGTSSSLPAFHLKNFPTHPHQQPQNPSMHLQGVVHNQNHHLGLRQSIGVVNLLRNSKYVKAAQELLEEFCSVGRGQFKGSRSLGRQNSNLNPNNNNNQSSGGTGSSSSSKDLPPLSAADRIDHQRKKTKLLTMLDEVDRRYNHYCEQMQVVVNSFDTVMGFGSATPYTSLAQKAMSRHFRCLKDAITTQLKQTCELLGDKDGTGGSGVTKGETPRLKMLEQSLRQQRAFNQMGMMEQEAWRPQRGLPERSVNILRAWLFEHFLHPYPSDADKHLLARQTGLSRNQVSNWFINARVRLWKPMVEEMYQQEAKDEEDGDEDDERESNQTNSNTAQATTSTQPETSPTTTTAGKRSLINDTENDSSLNAINTRVFSENQGTQINPSTTTTTTNIPQGDMSFHADVAHFPGDIIGVDYRTTNADADMAATLIRYGTTMGDVSLTLGLRHAGNLPEKNQFSVRDFGGC